MIWIHSSLCCRAVSRDERRAVLADLLRRLDLSEVPVAQLAEAIREAREQREGLQEFVGKAVAAMHHTGLTYMQIAEMTELPASNLHLWATPYL